MDLMDKIVSISIAVLVMVAILPTAAEDFFAVNIENWSATAQTMWNLIPVFVFIGIALMFIGYVRYKRSK